MKPSRLYKRVSLYTPTKLKELGSTFMVELRTLSHKELLDLDHLVENNRIKQLLIRVAELSILNLEELFNYWYTKVNKISTDGIPPYEYLNNIDYSVLLDIGTVALSLSKAENDFYEKLDVGIDLVSEEKFQTESWTCEVCKEKRLDKIRNCGYLGEKDKDKKFFVYVGENKYSYCPIYDLDKELVSQAFLCYAQYDKGILPEAGGLYDQTQFFVLSTQFVAMKQNAQQQKELDKMKRSR